MNDFSALDAQSAVSGFVQLSPAEIIEANTYYDDLRAAEEAQAINTRNWEMLTEIHSEIAPVLDALRAKQLLIDVL